MNKRKSVYRYTTLFVLLLFIALTNNSCKIATPENGNGDNGGSLNDPIGTETIGSSGGEINLDSIIVKIPTQALDGDYDINIYAVDGSEELSEFTNSSLYKIRGLPNTINAPIKFEIKYQNDLDGDPMALIGQQAYAVSLDSLIYTYRSIEAQDSSGYLVFEILGNQGVGKLSKSKMSILDWALDIIIPHSYVSGPSSNGNFNLSFPFIHSEQAIKMGEHFENAFATCRAMGFSFLNRTFPIDVLVKSLNGAYGAYSTFGANNMTDADLRSWIDDGSFTVDYSALNDNIELPVTCGHEFLHFVQNEYEFSSSWIEPEQGWMEEATSTWIEDKYAVTNNYISAAFLGREMYPFDGWQYSGRGYSKQGYGLPIIFKEISSKYGDNKIVEIFERVKNGALPGSAVDPVDAIKFVVEQHEPLSDFWHRTLSNYILGNYFNNQVNFTILDNSFNYIETGELDELNQSQSISKSMHDLSGQLVKVKTGDFGTMDKVPFTFIISDSINCGLTVFKFKEGQVIEKLDSFEPGGKGRLTINDVKPFLDDGYEIIALISNGNHDINSNYQANTEIELTVEMSSEPEIESIVISVDLKDVTSQWTQSFLGDTYVSSGAYAFRPITFWSEPDASVLTDNVFSYTWNNYDLPTYGRLENEVGYLGELFANGNMTITFKESSNAMDVYMHQVRIRPPDTPQSNASYITKYETEITINFDGLKLISSDVSYETYNVRVDTYAAFGNELHFLEFGWVFTKDRMVYVERIGESPYHYSDTTIGRMTDFNRINGSEFKVEVHFKQ
ncbi:hypothetical protein ACFLZA_00980 [Candidatus Neomarinimicrobiota bacterium]